MKKTAILAALLLSTSSLCAYAQNAQPRADNIPAVSAHKTVRADAALEKISQLQTKWARIKYKVSSAKQAGEMNTLSTEAAAVAAEFPDRAEPKIWQAIILSTEAGFDGGLSALPKVKQAKALLEASLKIDPKALDGSAATSLGSLYYKVPGWPIGFGDDEKAEKFLKSALAMTPDAIDPNFFYGDYLVGKKKYSEAIPVLEKALQAPDRPGRADADEGRRTEIRALLATAKSEVGNSAEVVKNKYN